MRLVDVQVPASSLDRVTELLEEEGVDFVAVPTTDDEAVVSFPIPPQGVDDVLELFDEAGVGDSYTVVATAETARTEHMEQLEERYVAADRETDSVALAEVRSRALGMNPSALTYYSMTLLSAVVATAGLLLDAPTIVVGSMVIAPQVGTAMTTGVGAVANEREMVLDGLRSQILGLAVAILGAALFGYLLKSAEFVPPALNLTTTEQISKRISPGLLAFAVGICAGGAGAFGLATALPVSLVGVMIAAALIPAAGAAGIGLAWGIPAMTRGSLVLLLVNVVCINVSTVGVLWLLDYRPPGWEDTRTWSVRTVREFTPTVATVLVLVVAFVGAGVAVSEQVQTTNAVNEEVSTALEEGQYRELELREVYVEFDTGLTQPRERTVSVTVARPVEKRYPELAETLDRRLTRTLGEPVVVDVTFVPRQKSGAL